MDLREKWRELASDERVRFTLFVIGCILIACAPIVGVLPGPGGIIVFAVGAGMALKYSHWAKKRYVAFKKRFPKYGDWADWSLRRASARRRARIAKEQEGDGD